jgi:hypothetical protein
MNLLHVLVVKEMALHGSREAELEMSPWAKKPNPKYFGPDQKKYIASVQYTKYK